MSHPLDGCDAKLDRADVHIGALDTLRRLFLDMKPYGIVTDVDRELLTGPGGPLHGADVPPGANVITGPDVRVEYVVYGRIICQVPTLPFGVLIGDAINDLRAALDNLVWELTIQYQASLGTIPPLDPIPAARKGDPNWRGVAFPITVHKDGWSNLEGKCLWGVRPGLRADFKRLQPFITGQDGDPTREQLALLEELWNIDKHRHLHVGQSFVKVNGVSSSFRESFPPEMELPEDFDIEFQAIWQRDEGPFEDGAELARCVPAGRWRIGTFMEPMYMKADLSFDIAFDQGAPAYGAKVLETLQGLRQACRTVVDQFRPEFGP